ncbi:MAG: glutamine-hydrolyzing carbamoyl-phosphate synthase small subunit [Candidatus Peribacteraceae bacterium]
MATLILQDGTTFVGQSFGAAVDTDGEVVFSTGMVGYPESMTDPSFRGQILTFTFPLIGNYGVPSEEKNHWGFSKNLESEAIHVRGVIVSTESRDYSHHKAVSSLHNWMEHHKIPGISGIDTRALTKKLRETGVMLGRIVQDDQKAGSGERVAGSIPDPNLLNLVAEVSCKEVVTYEPEGEVRATVLAYDCGTKRNIFRSWLKLGVRVHRVPWDFDFASSDLQFDGLFLSNGPGDPKMCTKTIEQVKKAIEKKIPTFGICLGNQLLALAIGGDTYKLKYGHRGVNQPCIEWKDGVKTDHCIITSQNHGFAVDEKRLPEGWHVWFTNANDGSVEGIRHSSGLFSSVQFHPEATPGPEDAGYLFDEFLTVLKK